MNTQNPIQVWTDDTGDQYAAQQLEPGKVGFYVYRTASRDSYGTTGQGPTQYATRGFRYALPSITP